MSSVRLGMTNYKETHFSQSCFESSKRSERSRRNALTFHHLNDVFLKTFKNSSVLKVWNNYYFLNSEAQMISLEWVTSEARYFKLGVQTDTEEQEEEVFTFT